jgi:hypothetical protein
MKTDKENWDEAVEREAQLNSDKELDLAGFRTRQEHRICAFKAGVAFATANILHEPRVKSLNNAARHVQGQLLRIYGSEISGMPKEFYDVLESALQKLEKGAV